MFSKNSIDKYYIAGGALLFALAVSFAVRFVPLGDQFRFVVRVKDGTVKQIVAPNETWKQEFSSSAGSVEALTLYFDSDTSASGLKVGVLDKNGVLLASGKIGKINFGDARSDVTYYFKKIELVSGEKYFISLKNTGLVPIGLWARDLPDKKLVAFSLISPVKISLRSSVGVIAGIIFLLGLAAVKVVNQKYRLFGIIILLALVTPIALGGFWRMDKLGISDWDYYMSTHSAYRQAVLVNHVFPFWEPYTSGGTAGLADPEFPLLSPLFVPELIFGVPIGIRLAVMFSVFFGGVGMLALARRIQLSHAASALAAIAYMFGSVNLLEIVEGHTNIYMAMWIPWIFWAWLGMLRGKTKPIVCAVFLALTFYGGGIYLLMYTAIAFVGLGLFAKKPINALVQTVKSGLWALGFSAFKLVPVFLWLKNYPDATYASSVNTLPWLKQIFLERIPHGAQAIFNQGGGWHEYGAYLGYFLVILALFGLVRLRNNKTVRLLSIATVLAIFISASGPIFKPFFDAFPYIPRSNVSRFVLFAVIPLVLLAGFGVDVIREKIRRGNILALVIIGCVAVDLMSFSYRISTQAFVLDPLVLAERAEYPIEFTADDYSTTAVDVNGNDVKYSRSYSAFLAGYGSTTFPSVLGPDARVKTIQDEKHAYLELENGRGSAVLVSWNPNRVIASIDATAPDNLIINTNYAPGWFVNGMPAREIAGRVATHVEQGKTLVKFEYKTPGLMTGSAITLITLGLVWFFHKKPRLISLGD